MGCTEDAPSGGCGHRRRGARPAARGDPPALKEAEEATADHDRLRVQVAVGYGGRQEITDALRSLLLERRRAASPRGGRGDLRPEDIGDHLYTTGLPDPDLIIRTSGEVRLSGFLLWQSAHSEFYFCDAYWPEFRKVDFLRALRDYQRAPPLRALTPAVLRG
jgi:short-chain Z-isoprenyl diphosphate synthase